MASFLEGSLGRIFVVRLPTDGDLLKTIEGFAGEMGVEAGVLWVIGAVRKAVIKYYNQEEKKYSRISLNKPLEILSCIGNISKLEGKIIAHVHLVLGDKDGKTFGGHLDEGTKIFSAEMILLEVKNVVLERVYDEVTGLNLFNL
ncbi:MAG: DNA-binding protein [Candidatus Hecatellales archaeon]|nr:MAG: DNA-binding protein [Candidatus Hecatellales archaeon]